MKNRTLMNLVMAILVAGLFLTVSCAKTTVVSDAPAIQDQSDVSAGDTDAMNEEKIREQMMKEKELAEAKAMAAKARFENQDVHFEYDSSDLSAMAKTLLQEKAAWLQANATVKVMVEGHCDERGTTEYNLALGERRANAAKAYLVDLGVAASRLNTISYGEERPVDNSNTEDGFRKNRRAHFVIK